MKIWLIKEGEPLPMDLNPRLMRMGLLAEYLERRGHQVTWITSTFDHGRKVYRYKETKKTELSERYQIVALHPFMAYKRNVSIERIVYNKIMALQFKRWSRGQTAPDVLLCSYPTAELARQAAGYCRRHKTALVLDVRDLWPDIFVRAFPDCMRHLAEAALKLPEFRARRVFSRADAVIGVSPYFVKWGLMKAGREKKSMDQCFPIAYKAQAFESEDLQEEFREWERKGVRPDTKNICFFGAFNRKKLDLSTVIRACKRLSETYPEIRVVLCGTGDDLEYYKELAGPCNTILFPGWMNGKQIQALLKMGMLSLYPMKNLIDFKNSIGNKMVEYLSHGLPVLSCSEGYAGHFIREHKAGYLYKEGDVEDCIRNIEDCCRDSMDGCEERRKHIRTVFSENFEAERIHRRLEAYLEELAQQCLNSRQALE